MDFHLHFSLIWLVFTHGGTSPERERLSETFAQAGGGARMRFGERVGQSFELALGECGGAEYLMERATQPLAPIDYPQPRHAGVQRHGCCDTA